MSFRYRLPDGRMVGSMTYTPTGVGNTAMAGTVSDVLSSDAVTYGSAALCAFHGYRRTRSLFWTAIWALAGKKLPVVAVPVALAQGIGKRKPCPTE